MPLIAHRDGSYPWKKIKKMFACVNDVASAIKFQASLIGDVSCHPKSSPLHPNNDTVREICKQLVDVWKSDGNVFRQFDLVDLDSFDSSHAPTSATMASSGDIASSADTSTQPTQPLQTQELNGQREESVASLVDADNFFCDGTCYSICQSFCVKRRKNLFCSCSYYKRDPTLLNILVDNCFARAPAVRSLFSSTYSPLAKKHYAALIKKRKKHTLTTVAVNVLTHAEFSKLPDVDLSGGNIASIASSMLGVHGRISGSFGCASPCIDRLLPTPSFASWDIPCAPTEALKFLTEAKESLLLQNVISSGSELFPRVRLLLVKLVVAATLRVLDSASALADLSPLIQPDSNDFFKTYYTWLTDKGASNPSEDPPVIDSPFLYLVMAPFIDPDAKVREYLLAEVPKLLMKGGGAFIRLLFSPPLVDVSPNAKGKDGNVSLLLSLSLSLSIYIYIYIHIHIYIYT